MNGFALPTVMIASVVMMMVLLSGLTSASSINTAIRSQYYNKMATRTAESGIAFTQACLKKNNYVAQWSNANPLRPNTDCAGTPDAGYTCPVPTSTSGIAIEQRCGVVETPELRTTFTVSGLSGTTEKLATVTATVYLLRGSSRTVASTQTVAVQQSVVFKNNPAASRPAKRFWLFGLNAGIDFDNDNATAPRADMKCAAGATCLGSEGYTVISTKSGNLQFWTDGKTIWNRNGNVMNDSNGVPTSNPFGAGGLNATNSTTQAAAVLPTGADETRYVIVTNNTESAVNNVGELYYSIVDMTLNGGLGAVQAANKNTALISGQTDYASEAMTAAPKADGSGYWVVTYTPDSSRIVAVPFNNTGTPGAPVYTTAPFTPAKFNASSGFGTLNFNADYTKLVMMAGNHCVPGACSSAAGMLRTMTFDTVTGMATRQFEWNNYQASGGQGYSADFSPNGENVYTTTLYPGRVFRFRLAGAVTNQNVIDSVGMGNDTAVTTNVAPGYGGGQVLRAPDNKMYVANWGANAISVINNPDAALVGDVGWSYNGRSLCVLTPVVLPCDANNSVSRYGLPQMVTIYSPLYLRY